MVSNRGMGSLWGRIVCENSDGAKSGTSGMKDLPCLE